VAAQLPPSRLPLSTPTNAAKREIEDALTDLKR